MQHPTKTLLDTPITLTPAEFEQQVEHFLRISGVGLSNFQVQRVEKLAGSDGVYEIDVAARFEALGADFLVLIECKHYKNAVKRDVAQVLYDRIRAVGAHKGMIFTTSTFQRGAIEYARTHGIALVQVADGRTSYFTKSQEQPAELPPWVPKYVAWIRSFTPEGNDAYTQVINNEPSLILQALGVDKSL